MCLTVILGDLGAAHAGLDVSRLTMVFSPHTNPVERTMAARWLLSKAGQPQSFNRRDEIICLCGLLLDLTLPVFLFPQVRPTSTGRVSGFGPIRPPADVGRELVLEASTGGFPALREDDLAAC